MLRNEGATERCRALVSRLTWTWRERCVVEALLSSSRPDGASYLGNGKLQDRAQGLGPAAAQACGFSRYRGSWRRFGRVYFSRVLQRLVRRGIVSRTWFLSAGARWVRGLRLSESGLRAYVKWQEDYGRPWRWGRDPIPVRWEDYSRSFPYLRRMHRPAEFARTPEVRRASWRRQERAKDGNSRFTIL